MLTWLSLSGILCLQFIFLILFLLLFIFFIYILYTNRCAQLYKNLLLFVQTNNKTNKVFCQKMANWIWIDESRNDLRVQILADKLTCKNWWIIPFVIIEDAFVQNFTIYKILESLNYRRKEYPFKCFKAWSFPDTPAIIDYRC